MTPLHQGRVAGLDLDVRPRDENFGILFDGYITVPGTGDYTFTLKDDDGAIFCIHAATVIDDDFNHTGEAVSGTIRLAAGRHPFRLYYRHGAGPRELFLTYSGPGFSNRPVPAGAFSLAGTADPRPQPFDDFASTPENTAVLIPVLANDTDDGRPLPLALQSVDQPQNGATAKAGNLVRYTPRRGFVGRDHFRYTITDGANVAGAMVAVLVSSNEDSIWFPFDESSGLETRSADGEIIGNLEGFGDETAQWVAGLRNHALHFDGNGESVTINNGYLPPSGSASRTTTAWIKTRSSGAIIAWGPNAAGQKWIMRLESDQDHAGALRVEVGGGYVRGTKDLRDGQWHCVAAVLPRVVSPQTRDIKLFVDGVPEAVTALVPAPIKTDSAPVTIGVDCQDRYFDGDIDEVHIYNRALSAAEIASLYAGDKSAAAVDKAQNLATRKRK
jgi:Concanavalin A-like lectin/glucanases superfamily/Bacterial Ig domain/PA14 domain